MKAIIITAPGDASVLEMGERPKPEPGPSEIRVRVRASALNRADLLQRRGVYPAPPGAPADVPGLEYAGEVDAVGPGSGLWAVGNRVMGIVGGGGHAEYLCVHEREALRIPHQLDWPDAAAIPEAFLTAYDALVRQLDIQVGERVLIHAVGSGVGTAAVQIAHAAGAITFGTSRTIDKLGRASALGLDHGFDSSDAGWADAVAAAADDAGMNAIVDLIGGAYHEPSVRLLAERGRMIVVGTVAGSKVELDLGLLLRKRAHVIGTVLRTRPLEEKITLARDFSSNVLPLIAAGRIRPIVDSVYPFRDVGKAHRYMESNSSFGKIVLLW